MSDQPQDQRSGDQSVNYQAGGNITVVGATVDQILEITRMTFESNILRMQGIAENVVRERAEQLRAEFVDRLAAEKPQNANEAAEPDFQFALFDAQKAYARTGNAELSSILVNMLIDRVGREQRTLLSIVLGEALTAAPKLAPEQFDILSVSFLLRHVKFNEATDLRTLRAVLNRFLVPLLNDWPPSEPSYEHLVYAGCGTLSVLQVNLAKLFLDTYPEIFVPLQDDDRIIEVIRRLNGNAALFVDGFSTSPARNFILTSVGKALAHANLKRRIGEMSELSQWIF